MRFVLLLMLFIGGSAMAHQFTPTYPSLRPSFMPGVWTTEMVLFNSRQDIKYYEISVYDSEWNAVPFAISDRIFPVRYLDRKHLDIYIREQDIGVAKYICSKSKMLKNNEQITIVASRICSKIK